MGKYLWAVALLLAGCEIKPLLAPIERATLVKDNSLSNFIRASGLAQVGNRVYLAGLVLRERNGDFSWSQLGSSPTDGPQEEPIVDIAGVGADLWLATNKGVYQLTAGRWQGRGSRSNLRFGSTFFTAKSQLLLYDPSKGALWFNAGTWEPATSSRPLALIYQGGNYLLATADAIWQGSDLANLVKQPKGGGLPDTLAISDLVIGGSTLYLAANGAIYYGTDLRSWTVAAGSSSVETLTLVDNFLLATRASGGFGVWNTTTKKWAEGGRSDGFSDPDSFVVKSGDQSVDERKLSRLFYLEDTRVAANSRVYALSEGAHGMYAAHLDDGKRWVWERE